MASHLIALPIEVGEDADFLKQDIIPGIPGLTFLGFGTAPNPGSLPTAYIAAEFPGDAIALADQLGVSVDNIVMTELTELYFGN